MQTKLRHTKESMENKTQVQEKCMKEEKKGMEDGLSPDSLI